MGNKRSIKNTFSDYVDKYKRTYKIQSYMDSIIEIVNNHVFDFITFSNINQFLNKNIKSILFEEAKNKKMIKAEFVTEFKKDDDNNDLF